MTAAFTAIGIALLVMVGSTGHVPGSAAPPDVMGHVPGSAAAPPDSGDCQVNVIAEEGTPPPGTPRLDPQKLCDALKRAEQEAGQR